MKAVADNASLVVHGENLDKLCGCFFFRHGPVTQLIKYCGSTKMLSGRRTDIIRWTQSILVQIIQSTPAQGRIYFILYAGNTITRFMFECFQCVTPQSEDEGTTTVRSGPSFYTLTKQALFRILRLIYNRYLTSFPLLLDRVDSLSVFEKLRSCINPNTAPTILLT